MLSIGVSVHKQIAMGRNFFQRIPFIRISSLFIAGILIGYYWIPKTEVVVVLLAILFLLQLLLWNNSSFSLIRFQNILLSITIFLLGLFYISSNSLKDKPDSWRKDYFLAQVCQKPGEKARTFQTILSLQNNELISPEKVVAYFDKNEFDASLSTGDQLIILGKLQAIRNQGNPFEFDYQSMMCRRGIWYSVYLTRATYLKVGKPIVNLQNWAEKSRDYLVEKLAKVLPDKEERSVVSALTLGYRTELDQETLDYFASTGAMHVLSVSGLHVALLFMILGFLLGFLKRHKAGRILFPVVMILFLWIYAFISGFSPPVQRATLMFTFVIVGKELRRPVNIYNSLTASALLLILLDPNVIFDVGFQLSYLAIFSIVLVQPALFNLIEMKNKSLEWLWALFTVSIAAQIVTFPLGVFYFNQMPNFFWLSNFIVVPVTTIIMWATIAFFILSPFQILAGWAGFVIQKLTWFMLASLKLIDAHPLAVTHGLVFSMTQLMLVFSVIFAIIIFFYSKHKVWFTTALVLLIFFQAETLIEKYKLLNNRFLLVYNSKTTIVHLANGRANYLIVDDALKESDQKMVQKVVDHCRLQKPIIITRQKARNFDRRDLYVSPKSIYFLNIRIDFAKIFKNNTKELLVTSIPQSRREIPLMYFISIGYPEARTGEKLVYYTRAEGSYQLSLH